MWYRCSWRVLLAASDRLIGFITYEDTPPLLHRQSTTFGYISSGNGIYYKGIDPNRNLTFKNTVLANRVSGENCIVASDSVHGIASAGFNLSSDTSCDAYFTQPTDQTNVDPLLGPLAANGGFTMTHLPAPNSPIIDKGQCLAQIPTDQRGVARPQGPACDIGSVEVQVLGNFRAFVPIVLR